MRRQWMGSVAGLLALFCLVCSGCATNPVTGRSELAFYEVSETKEIELGQESYPKLIQQMGGRYQDPVLAAYVQEVGRKLAQVSHRPNLPYRFTVVNNSTPNAFAMPGGFIAVTRGLLAVLQNESQLAAVLGHEIGHVTARHAVQGIQRNLLLNLGLAVFAEATSGSSYSALARRGGELAATIIARSYSREQERESDRLGIDYMVRAGYNPRGAVELQEIFLRLSGEKDPLWIEGLFRTHPFSSERLQANRIYIQERYGAHARNPKAVVNSPGFDRALASVRATRKAYELYDQAERLSGKGKRDEAVELYRRAADLAPGESLIMTGLGLVLLDAGQRDEASRILRKAVALDGDYYASRLGLGYLELAAGNPQAAIPHLEHSMKLLPTLEGAYFLAEAYYKTGRYLEALRLYR